MQDVYRTNPALGDPSVLDPQIREATTKLEKLQAILSQHEVYLILFLLKNYFTFNK